jgi:hypothetical protein
MKQLLLAAMLLFCFAANSQEITLSKLETLLSKDSHYRNDYAAKQGFVQDADNPNRLSLKRFNKRQQMLFEEIVTYYPDSIVCSFNEPDKYTNFLYWLKNDYRKNADNPKRTVFNYKWKGNYVVDLYDAEMTRPSGKSRFYHFKLYRTTK